MSKLVSVDDFLAALDLVPACRFECENPWHQTCNAICAVPPGRPHKRGDNFACCRLSGHCGPHAACLPDQHAVRVWTDQPEETNRACEK